VTRYGVDSLLKRIGKPYSGKPNVRFDEGALEIELQLLRQLPTLLKFAKRDIHFPRSKGRAGKVPPFLPI
jgi:hypothetical protein